MGGFLQAEQALKQKYCEHKYLVVSSTLFGGGHHPMTNLCELWGVGTHQGLTAMMQMSGVEQAVIMGRASAYDQVQALLDVLPMWLGHPYVYALQDLLQKVVHAPLPTNDATLAEVWTKTAHVLAKEDLRVTDILAMYGYEQWVQVVEPQTPSATATPLPDVTAYLSPYHPMFPKLPKDCQDLTPPQAMAWLEHEMKAFLDTQTGGREGIIMADLAHMKVFCRPHPYTAGQVYLKLCQGGEVTEAEKDLFASQMLRILGQYAKERQHRLVWHQVGEQVYAPMTTYLSGCDGDASVICVAYTPEDAVALARCGAKVGLALQVCIPQSQVIATLEKVASGMPFGCLEGLYIPVTGLVEVPLAERIARWVDGWISEKYQRFGT